MGANISLRVNERQKLLAEKTLQKKGLTVSSACRMLINYLAVKGEMPEELLMPNADTLQAIADMEKGVGVVTYDSVEDLVDDLGWDVTP